MSLNLIKPQSSGHWYDPQTGESRHDADLRVARKEKLLPSVTSVLQILAKPALETWKINQAILASLTLPRLPGESDQDFAARVVRDFKEQSGAAADLGTRIHQFAEDVTNGLHPQPVPGLEEVCEKLAVWIGENLGPGVAEESITNVELGYAGRVDWMGQDKTGVPLIVDFKSNGNKDGKLAPYEDYCTQLAAYGEGAPGTRYINLMISTNPKYPEIRAHEWTGEEIARGWESFRACLKIWMIQKNYDPRGTD